MKLNSVLDIRDIKNQDTKALKLSLNNGEKIIHITRQKTGFGYKRFFICPNCGARRIKLYVYDQLQIDCRTCAPDSPYLGITHTTKGGHINITYRMHRIAQKYNISLKFPFSCYNDIEKPKHMRWDKWEEGIRKLQILENMRIQSITYENYHNKKKYNAHLIDYILKNCLYIYDLDEINQYLINWEAVAEKHKAWKENLLKGVIHHD